MDKSLLLEGKIAQAAERVRNGEVVAFPTESFYGLAVNPFSPDSLRILYRIKQRPHHKAILVLVDSIEMLRPLVKNIPTCYQSLMSRFWPGPLTLLFPAAESVPQHLLGDSPNIAIRISSHPVAYRLCQLAGMPITATSANISGLPPADCAAAVWDIFGEQINYILDGGQTEGKAPSSIVGQRDGRLLSVRDGQIPFPRILESLSES